MKVVTAISNKNDLGFFKLKMSCALKGLDLVTLTCDQDAFRNHRMKDRILRSYLSELDDNEIVLFTDGYDAIMLADEDEILEKFDKIGTDLLFSAETCCYPDKSLAPRYPATDSLYKYLNSGGFIGRAGLLKQLHEVDLSEVSGNFTYSNQYLWSVIYLENQHQMKLDTDCEIFCTFSPEITEQALGEAQRGNREAYVKYFYEWFNEHFIISNGRIYNKITGTWPCNAHFNGGASCFLEDYIESWEILYDLTPGRRSHTVIPVHPATV
ncbi:glycosyltransferase domain-containing protein [Chitinophaga rhizophila]|uniref:PLOD1-3-like GT domain-containing protein n=1 Tax=Chitinophaga rhizophila TaxID=2866212 RepID=A0ABS7GL77_9BACT|nr:glycosyltransferase domain-containing protein [Chitinophaga rhizophila]MBW8687208.1 hypothetical protein [Chitinophaga rhizophila]